MKKIAIGLSVLCVLVISSAYIWNRNSPQKKSMLVLGIDGMDPVLLEEYMKKGRMPNFQKLAESGSYFHLATSNPPQSPVAWSNFITGQGPAGHAIYDFIHRDPKTMKIFLSTSVTHDPESFLQFLKWQIPLGQGSTELLRKGQAFWEILEGHNVSATILNIPANFPPNSRSTAKSLSGMGTPDIFGTYGISFLFTTDRALQEKEFQSAKVFPLEKKLNKTLDFRWEGKIKGPLDPFLIDNQEMTLPMTLLSNKDLQMLLIRIDAEELMLKPQEWSAWIPLKFKTAIPFITTRGIAKFYLKSLTPKLSLYMSPINLDPEHAEVPISTPSGYSKKLSQSLGAFHTLGIPEDSKGLINGFLSEENFLEQTEVVFSEKKKLLWHELSKLKESKKNNFLFSYFGTIDLVSHLFFAALDPKSPSYIRRFHNVIPRVYEKFDELLGEIMQKLPPKTDLLVMSDHGFSSYKWKVNLNKWLLENKYLFLKDEKNTGTWADIDWSKTKAYALGFNQIYINTKDREKNGFILTNEKSALIEKISHDLKNFILPSTNTPVVTRVEQPIVDDSLKQNITPDLVVGFNREFRASDESILGNIPDQAVIESNEGKWSGDHCIDPDHVPGIMLTNFKINLASPDLRDLAPSILDYFQVNPPVYMKGKKLFRKAL